MAKAEQDIWNNMVAVGKFGNLQWVNPIDSKISSNPAIGGETRRFPERYIAMVGEIRTPGEISWEAFSTSIYKKVSLHKAEIESESTGVNGLLRIVDLLNPPHEQPKNIVQVGAFSPISIFCTLRWMEQKGWNNTSLTLVEPSPIPLAHLRTLKEQEFFDWPEKFSIVQGDFRHFNFEKPVDIVICDILNAWTIPAFYTPRLRKRTPYKVYEEIIGNAGRLLTKGGKLYSRSIVFPERNNSSPNSTSEEIVEERLNFLKSQIGPQLSEELDQEYARIILEDMFNKPSPPTYCCLEHVSKLYQNAHTLSGPRSENIMRRIHHRQFNQVSEMKVTDTASNCNFITFVCNN